MKHRNLILIFSMLLLLIVEVSANGAAAAAAVAASSAARYDEEDIMQKRQDSGCVLPLDFAKEHKCALYYPDRSDRRIGSFICKINENEEYNIIADCKGGVITYKKTIGILTTSYLSIFSIFFPLIIVIGLSLIIIKVAIR